MIEYMVTSVFISVVSVLVSMAGLGRGERGTTSKSTEGTQLCVKEIHEILVLILCTVLM